jgi:hypothetical protein
MTREQLYHEFLLPNPLAQSSPKETITECLLSPSKARHIVVPPADTSLFVVRTPKADASLLSLKDFENQVRHFPALLYLLICTVLYCTVLCCAVLYSTLLFCSVLCYAVVWYRVVLLFLRHGVEWRDVARCVV